MNQNPYLEKHTFINMHFVEKENGPEKIKEEHREELRLTEVGLRKESELTTLLKRESFWTRHACHIGAFAALIIIILSIAVHLLIFGSFSEENLIYCISIFIAILIASMKFLSYLDKRDTKQCNIKMAPLVAQFAIENLEFLQTLNQLNSYAWLTKECEQILQIYKEQEASAA